MLNISVVGAGTAGLLAALYSKDEYPSANITIIHDDKTPIIGVGEGTTPLFPNFLYKVGISIEDIVQNCDGTIKNTVKLTNWKGDNSHYHHGFAMAEGQREAMIESVIKKSNLDKIDLSGTLSENDKVFVNSEDTRYVPCKQYVNALHFDAKKLAEYLKNVAIERGVHMIVGKVKDVFRDKDDYVKYIVLDTNEQIETDFVFDCTGFARVFVDKIYKSPFKSYEKCLPVKRAMPFFLENNQSTPTFTEAIAMKYGWMWKIPVGNRYGCGYAFDSNYITDEQAYEEICEVTKEKPIIPRTISFKSGYYTKPLNKNTLSLGLSHGFLEPLEATSLMISLFMLLKLPKISYYHDTEINDYNKMTEEMVDCVVDLIYLHYLTPREDTDFWKNFETNNPMPEHTKKTLKKLSMFLLNEEEYQKQKEWCDFMVFHEYSFLKCIDSVDRLDLIENDFHKKLSFRETDIHIKSVAEIIENKVKNLKNHDEYLKYWTST